MWSRLLALIGGTRLFNQDLVTPFAPNTLATGKLAVSVGGCEVEE